jgi:hypothetical protein
MVDTSPESARPVTAADVSPGSGESKTVPFYSVPQMVGNKRVYLIPGSKPGTSAVVDEDGKFIREVAYVPPGLAGGGMDSNGFKGTMSWPTMDLGSGGAVKPPPAKGSALDWVNNVKF